MKEGGGGVHDASVVGSISNHCVFCLPFSVLELIMQSHEPRREPASGNP